MYETIFNQDYQWSLYASLNLTFALLMSAAFLVIFRIGRHHFVKPSLLIVLFYHALIQWPFFVLSNHCEAQLPRPWEAALYLHGFVLLGLLLSLAVSSNNARVIWSRLDPDQRIEPPSVAQLMLVLGICLALTAVYLSYVPFSETGLVVLLTDPASSVEARENSLKLLERGPAAYALTLVSSTVAPVYTAMTVTALLALSHRRRPLAALLLAGLFAVWTMGLLSGAKGLLLLLVCNAVAVLIWRRRLSVPLHWVFISIGLALLPAVLFTIPLLSDDMPLSEAVPLLLSSIAERTFILTTLVCLWFVDHLQSAGPVGIAGIPKLAWLFGAEVIDLPNRIGMIYGPDYYGHAVKDGISANAGFVFAYYAYFGFWSLPIVLVLLSLCNIVLWPIRSMPTSWLPIGLSLATVGSLIFVVSDYITVWLTHGFAASIALAWLVAVALPLTMGFDQRLDRPHAGRA